MRQDGFDSTLTHQETSAHVPPPPHHLDFRRILDIVAVS